jgi:hypothetical protein
VLQEASVAGPLPERLKLNNYAIPLLHGGTDYAISLSSKQRYIGNKIIGI